MQRRRKVCASSLILFAKVSRRLERDLVAVSACLDVSFLVGLVWGLLLLLRRAESTLLGLRVDCCHGRRRREYWMRQSTTIAVLVHLSLLKVVHRIARRGQVAKPFAGGEGQSPDVSDDGWNSFVGIELRNAIHFCPIVEGYQPLPIRTSPGCGQLADFTCVPHCDRINEERPVEGI